MIQFIVSKISFFFRCFSQIFAIAHQLPSYSISGSENVQDFWNINVSMNNYSWKICLCTLLKLGSYCSICLAMLNCRDVVRTSSRIYHGAFLQKYITSKSRQLYLHKISNKIFNWVLNVLLNWNWFILLSWFLSTENSPDVLNLMVKMLFDKFMFD